MKVSIFGLGYVGCVSIGCLAKNGHDVIGVDLNETKVRFINDGKASIIENRIDELIERGRKENKISATTDSHEAVLSTDISIICVGTPSTKEGHLNLDAIYKVAKEIGAALKLKDTFHVVIVRSTVLPGTNKKVESIIAKKSGKVPGSTYSIVSNPEFLREGTAIKDYYNPPFTLVGGSNEKAIEIVREMYKEIEAPFIETDIKIAEFMKYVNNAFHAYKITFANEIGNICKKLNIDGHKLMDIFCMDKKLNISSYYLKPGFAYGGSCLPKDLKALKTIAHDRYLDCPVLENIEISNEVQKRMVLNQLIEFKKKRIGFLGLSFKSGTDDLRNSPIVDVIEVLVGKGYEISIYDSKVHFSKIMGANKEYILQKIPLISKLVLNDIDKLIENSDIIVIVNKEQKYEEIAKEIPSNKIIYDLVNIDIKDKISAQYSGIAW